MLHIVHLSFSSEFKELLALRVLWRLTGTLQTGFLAFLHARIACQETFLLQNTAKLGAEFAERASDAVLNGARLTVRSASGHTHMNIKLVQSIRSFQRPLYEHPMGFMEEVLFEILIVDGKVSCARSKDHTRRRCLSTARAQVLN